MLSIDVIFHIYIHIRLRNTQHERTTKNGLRSLSSCAYTCIYMYISIYLLLIWRGVCAAYKTHMAAGKFVTYWRARVTGAVRQLFAARMQNPSLPPPPPRGELCTLEYCRSWLGVTRGAESFPKSSGGRPQLPRDEKTGKHPRRQRDGAQLKILSYRIIDNIAVELIIINVTIRIDNAPDRVLRFRLCLYVV